jgi:flagellar basal-body rod protein FlgB
VSAFSGVDTSQLLVNAMKVCKENHRILASNIANIDTPNYSPLRMDFQSALRQALNGQGRISLRTMQPQHIGKSTHRPMFERLVQSPKNDYNTVDLDDQMAQLAQNTDRYTGYGSLLVKQFDQIKSMLTAMR